MLSAMVAVHSVNLVAFTVPDLIEAERFYKAFGLETDRAGRRLGVAAGGACPVLSIHRTAGAKKLAFVCYGVFEEAIPEIERRVEKAGLGCDPHPLGERAGVWLRDPDGIAIQVVPASRGLASRKAEPAMVTKPAPARSAVGPVRPRRLSHVLRFTPDVPRMVRFCTEMLGLRLSDHSGDFIAFLHSPHGGDHHLVAFAKSESPGLHHSSWEVGSIDEIGCGAEQMKRKGYSRGWGVGRHVIGSNYFYYVQDPWGSFAEYSFDIDFIAASADWQPRDYAPEDSLCVWGPAPPDDFVKNYEA